MNKNDKHVNMLEEAREDMLEVLKDYSGYYCELHNDVFNTGYYIIGTTDAKRALNLYDVFKALGLVNTYERDNFGEVLTDTSDPEKLVNMLYYIIGEEANQELQGKSKTFNENWNEQADDETNQLIIDEWNG